jgi:hypothetical protein
MPPVNPLLSLFKEQLENESRAIAEQNGLTVRGHFLIWWYFTKLHGMTPAQINEVVCDGSGDLGLDAIYIDSDDYVHFYQFKNPEGQETGIAGGDIDKVLSGLNLILQGRHNAVANQEVKARIEEIYQTVPNGYRLHLVSSGRGVPADSVEKLNGFVAELRGPTDSYFRWLDEDLSRLQDAFYTRNLPTLEQPIIFELERQPPYQVRSADHDSYLFHSSGSTLAGLYATHGEKLLQQNIRVSQGDTATNTSIKQTCGGPESANFIHYNNGVTFLCESAVWDQFVSKLTLNKAQVVNGGQTIRALYGAGREGSLQGNVLVSVRVITSRGDKEFGSNVAVNLNNQNRMESSFLRSNNPRVVQLGNSLASLGWFLERREGEVRSFTTTERAAATQRIGRDLEGRVISLKDGAQAYAATYARSPELAKKNPQKIFMGVEDGGFFERIFSDEMTAEKFMTAHQIKSFVDLFVNQFMTRKRKKARVENWKEDYKSLLGSTLVDKYEDRIDQVIPQSAVFLCAILFEEHVRIKSMPADRLIQDLSRASDTSIQDLLSHIIEQGLTHPEASSKSWPTLLKSQTFFELVSTFLRGRASVVRAH